MMKQRDRDILNFLSKYRGLTIDQATRLFFKGYSYAQKRLKFLENQGLIRSYYNPILNDKVYILQDKISTHDLYVIELYTRLIEDGCEIIDFIPQYKCFRDQLRPDAYISFIKDGGLYFYFVECIDTYDVKMSKFQTYEMFYKTNEMQEICKGVFPAIMLLGFSPLQYESSNYDTVYINFEELKDSRYLSKIL